MKLTITITATVDDVSVKEGVGGVEAYEHYVETAFSNVIDEGILTPGTVRVTGPVNIDVTTPKAHVVNGLTYEEWRNKIPAKKHHFRMRKAWLNGEDPLTWDPDKM